MIFTHKSLVQTPTRLWLEKATLATMTKNEAKLLHRKLGALLAYIDSLEAQPSTSTQN